MFDMVLITALLWATECSSWTQLTLSYENQYIDLLCKSMDWFLFDRDLRNQGIKNYFTQMFYFYTPLKHES